MVDSSRFMIEDSTLSCRKIPFDFLFSQTNYETFQSIPYSQMAQNLDRLQEFLTWLGAPQNGYPILHVAGTKGKGSVCMILEQALRRSGFRTGLFTSPHVLSVCERFQINGAPCTEEELGTVLLELRQHWEEFERSRVFEEPLSPLTFFEWTVLIALALFARRKVDVAILEVGLGGRFDATNVCLPAVSVLTSVSYDHQEQLGQSLAEIAREKAGIIKTGRPVVSGITSHRWAEQDEHWQKNLITTEELAKAESVVESIAREKKAPISLIREISEAVRSATIAVPGQHQRWNAELALEVLRQFANTTGKIVPEPIFFETLQSLKLPWRFEIVQEEPPFILDGAHNRASFSALGEALEERFGQKADSSNGPKRTLFFGASHGKDLEGMLVEAARFFDRIYLIEYHGKRSVTLPELARCTEALRATRLASWPGQFHLVKDPHEALKMERQRVEPDRAELLCGAGSFYLLAELMEILR